MISCIGVKLRPGEHLNQSFFYYIIKRLPSALYVLSSCFDRKSPGHEFCVGVARLWNMFFKWDWLVSPESPQRRSGVPLSHNHRRLMLDGSAAIPRHSYGWSKEEPDTKHLDERLIALNRLRSKGILGLSIELSVWFATSSQAAASGPLGIVTNVWRLHVLALAVTGIT